MNVRILRTKDAADYIGVSQSRMEKWRLSGDGPLFIRLGGRAIGYDIRDLDAWLDKQRGATASKNEQPPSAA